MLRLETQYLDALRRAPCETGPSAELRTAREKAPPDIAFPAGAWERVVGVLIAMAALPMCCGCVQEMANQPRVEPLEASARGQDVAPPREPVPGTVSRGHYWLDEEFATGRVAGQFASELPQSLSEYFAEGELLSRGHDRYEIFCSHCHGLTGGGDGGDVAMRSHVGMVVRRGFPVPPTYHQPRLRAAPLGHLFEVITHGVGRMPAHGSLIPPQDRWAIAAYVKVLQLSQFAPRAVLSQNDLQRLDASSSRNQ